MKRKPYEIRDDLMTDFYDPFNNCKCLMYAILAGFVFHLYIDPRPRPMVQESFSISRDTVLRALILLRLKGRAA